MEQKSKSVRITEQGHFILKELSKKRGISQEKILEESVNLLWENERKKRHRKEPDLNEIIKTTKDENSKVIAFIRTQDAKMQDNQNELIEKMRKIWEPMQKIQMVLSERHY